MINRFQVKPPSDLSDHCLITANLYCHKQQPQIEEQELWSPPGSFKWSDQNKDTFIDCLLNQNSTYNILSLNELWDDISFNDIDFLVGKTNEIYIQAAKKSVHFKAVSDKTIHKKRAKKAKP